MKRRGDNKMKCDYCREVKAIVYIDLEHKLCSDCYENLQIRWDEDVTDSLEAWGTAYLEPIEGANK
jgi:hypothetical protein